MRAIARNSLCPLALSLALAAPEAVRAETPWSQGIHARARLIAAGRDGEARLAGIEIALDRGFKTYWRQPGEAGLPPRFDWTRSANAAAIEVLWPAPQRHEDAGGVSNVYLERVVLPVRVRPADPGKPVDLRLSLDYGICKDICIPARAELSAVLPAGGAAAASREALAVRSEGLARVPERKAVGADGPLAIASVAAAPEAGGKPAWRVTVRGPADATLFAEGPADWYVATSTPDGTGTFTVTLEDKPKDATGPVVLRLTLGSGSGAVEADVALDEALRLR